MVPKNSENFQRKLLEIHAWKCKTSLDTTKSKVKRSESRTRQKRWKIERKLKSLRK